jgi:formyl-CoA transferase
VPLLQTYFIARSVGHWVDTLLAEGIPCGPINGMDQVFGDPQVLARQMVQQIAHPTAGTIGVAGVPYNLAETPAGIDRHPPLHGEHTDEVLAEIGYHAEAIDRLHADGVV